MYSLIRCPDLFEELDTSWVLIEVTAFVMINVSVIEYATGFRARWILEWMREKAARYGNAEYMDESLKPFYSAFGIHWDSAYSLNPRIFLCWHSNFPNRKSCSGNLSRAFVSQELLERYAENWSASFQKAASSFHQDLRRKEKNYR